MIKLSGTACMRTFSCIAYSLYWVGIAHLLLESEQVFGSLAIVAATGSHCMGIGCETQKHRRPANALGFIGEDFRNLGPRESTAHRRLCCRTVILEQAGGRAPKSSVDKHTVLGTIPTVRLKLLLISFGNAANSTQLNLARKLFYCPQHTPVAAALLSLNTPSIRQICLLGVNRDM
jgi:hypothetical protein